MNALLKTPLERTIPKSRSVEYFIATITHRVERIHDKDDTLSWVELLVFDLNDESTPEEILSDAKAENHTSEIFDLWLRKACKRISRMPTKWIPLITSINAYIRDLTVPNFRRKVTSIMSEYWNISPRYIQIELVEEMHWEDIGTYIKNVNWLKSLWFLIAVDDYALLEGGWLRDFSRRNLWLFWSDNQLLNKVDKIKLDYITVQKILTWDILARRKLAAFRRKYPQILIIAEWISGDQAKRMSQIKVLKPLWISYFQIYNKIITSPSPWVSP